MLFSRDLHVFSLLETVNTLVVYLPITLDQQPINAIGSAAWTSSGQSTHFTKSTWFIIHSARLVSLSTAGLIEDTTCSTLRHLLWSQTTT